VNPILVLYSQSGLFSGFSQALPSGRFQVFQWTSYPRVPCVTLVGSLVSALPGLLVVTQALARSSCGMFTHRSHNSLKLEC
jgi:hypothetical protein